MQSTATKKVLIVDDEKDLLATLLDFFESFSEAFTLEIAHNGSEALDVLSTEEISLLVTDIMMPEMDGLTLLSHMMNRYPTIPCIVFSAYGTPDIQEKLEKLGALYYLEKPFKLETLASYIVKILKDTEHAGFLNAIALESFLQLLEMEKKSGIIEIAHRRSEHKGHIYLSGGELVDAHFLEKTGEEAVYEILLLDKHDITIAVHFREIKRDKKITNRMMHIIMEAMRLKDDKKRHKIGAEITLEQPFTEPEGESEGNLFFDIPDDLPAETANTEIDESVSDNAPDHSFTPFSDKDPAHDLKESKKKNPGKKSAGNKTENRGNKEVVTIPSPFHKEEVMAISKDVLKSLNSDVEGLQVASIFGSDGLPLIINNPGRLDVDAFSAKFAMVSKLVTKTVKDLSEGVVEEILVEEDKGWILVRPIGKSGLFMIIAVSSEATLGNLRLVAKSLVGDIVKTL